MDANMINPFLQATLEIIRDTAHLHYQLQKIYRKKDDKGRGDITGIIGLSGSGKGTVAVTFDQRTILYITSKILDMEPENIDEATVMDTAGELANMITGRAVRILSEKGFDLNLTVPTVVHGPDHKVIHQAGGPKIAIPYSSDQGNFTVEFSFDEDMKPDMPQPAAETPNESGNKTPSNWGVSEAG
ncbi:MAG: chemotaxis protein CheX [Pseudomonadota bacterium]